MPPYETYPSLEAQIKSEKKIKSWNNHKRICARCQKEKLETIAEREHNCCLICGLEMLLK